MAMHVKVSLPIDQVLLASGLLSPRGNVVVINTNTAVWLGEW